MAYEFNGSSQYLRVASAVVSNSPCSFAAFKYFNNADTAYLFVVTSSSSDTGLIGIALSGFLTGDPITMDQQNSLGTQYGRAATTVTPTLNQWSHAAGTSSGTSQRTAYVNGGSSGSNTTTSSGFTLNQTIIGALVNNSSQHFLNGRSAEAAIWNAGLTADEVASLAKGFKPTRIRPQSLVFYAPLIRDLQDTRGGLTITNNNSATVADHPRVY